MIAYEDLVAALNSWRGRNGLQTTPPDYGQPVPAPAYDDADREAPDEVYDLSDDSGLIMTEDIAQAGEIGSIETGVEIAQTADEGVDGDYDNPPATGDYGDYSDDAYADAASAEAYDDAPVETVDVDEAGVIEEEIAVGETLEADAGDVVEEQTAYDDPMPVEDSMDAYAEPSPLDEPPAYDDIDAAGIIGDEPLPMDDEDLGGETVVAADPNDADEPDALPDMPDPDDESR